MYVCMGWSVSCHLQIFCNTCHVVTQVKSNCSKSSQLTWQRPARWMPSSVHTEALTMSLRLVWYCSLYIVCREYKGSLPENGGLLFSGWEGVFTPVTPEVDRQISAAMWALYPKAKVSEGKAFNLLVSLHYNRHLSSGQWLWGRDPEHKQSTWPSFEGCPGSALEIM